MDVAVRLRGIDNNITYLGLVHKTKELTRINRNCSSLLFWELAGKLSLECLTVRGQFAEVSNLMPAKWPAPGLDDTRLS